ncbi:DNA-binding cell septation regulator SpoVG [Azospirillum agricola]|uniref:SIR2 family protein n=1 Tax=Azospirillum agricola TaxID=1720247 RepID=UPI001AEB8ED2|nr:SIR2 family protein [Azospirillum agricola]MBP2230390.1 DNA-binding cell septation regulator SpoVG [Azospirillum agricola]
MQLPEPSKIETGTSILFLGAGFSAEATNTKDESIKDVESLITYLLGKVGIASSEGYDLDTASEEFQKVYGDEATVVSLHNNFRTKVYTEDQATIVTQPWRRIYTTNYDDVIETICSDSRKSITKHDVRDSVSQPMPSTTQLLHIYGDIGRASAQEFAQAFLLTERQRDNSPFLKSPWMRAFQNDVLAASSVVFVGFSISDIDIRRLLGLLPSEVHEKIHFVTRTEERQPIITRMSKFGTPHPIGLSAFAAHLGRKRPGAAVTTYTVLPVTIHEMFYTPKLTASVSAPDLERLFISGVPDLDKLSQADISAEPGSYTISRSRHAYQRAGNNASGVMPILVNSDIGNGKTIFADQIGYQYAQKNYRVFKFQREPDNIGDILAYLQALEDSALLIFDDVMRFPKLPTAILELRKSNLVILATVRTSFLDTSLSAVKSRLGNATCVQIDLDSPQRDETKRTVEYLAVNGLLGKYSNLTDNEKLDFVEKTCGSQLRDIVLSLYETGVLHSRVEELLINVQKLDKNAQDLIIFSAILTQAGYQELSEVWLLTELLDYSGALEDLRASLNKQELGSLVRIDQGDLSIRSPALAEFILRRVFNLGTILDVVKRALTSVHNNLTSEEDLVKMAKGLLKFSVYSRIIRSDRENVLIERFYDDCRLLSFAASDPLFWVQRSICTMKNKQFDISFRFIDNAYGLARSRRNWDTYQIDNHKARVLLTQSHENGVSVDGSREKDALSLLQAVLARKNDDLYHPLSVMRIYAEIVDKYIHTLTFEQKNSLKHSIESAIRSISKFRHTGRFRNLTELRSRLANSVKALD